VEHTQVSQRSRKRENFVAEFHPYLSGNAVSCAAAWAVLNTFDKENILDNVQARHEQLMGLLNGLKKSPAGSVIQQIRGYGLMIGVQFVHPKIKGVMDSIPHGTNANSHNTSAQDPWLYESGQEQLAPKIVQACVKRDMLVLSTSW
jgi:4-aminobutyrate aminotransferase